MSRFVSYFDCSGWESSLEVMNAQEGEGHFNLLAYSQDGKLLLNREHSIDGNATVRIKLNDDLAGHQGKIVLEPTAKEADAFPAIMVHCPNGVDFKLGNRFIPFTKL
jgi:hypothetical protein